MKRLRCGKIMKLATCAALLAGCAQIPKDAGFSDVQHTVAKRIGESVAWSRDAVGSRKIQQAVDDLLKEKLTTGAAVRIALLNNRDLQSVYENLGIAQAQLVAAGLIPNPVFDGNIKFNVTGGGGGNIADLSVAQNFLDVLFIPLRKKIAAARFEQTKLGVSEKVLALAGRTRRAFYDLQAQTQLTAMLRKVVHATRDAYEMAQRLHQAGNIAQLDVDRQQVLYEQAKLDLASQQALTTQDHERLNRLMGLWGKRTKWAIATHLPELPDKPLQWKDLEKRAITASLNLAQARAHVEALGQRVGVSGLAGIFESSGLGIAAEHDPGEPWFVGPSLSLPIPLFNMGQPALAEVRAQVHQAFDSYTAMAINIRSQARALRSELLTDRRKAAYDHDEVLPLRQRITQRSQLQYNAMQIGVFELLQAKRLEIDAGREYIRTLRDYWRTRSKMDQLLAGSLPREAGTSEGATTETTQTSLSTVPTLAGTQSND